MSDDSPFAIDLDHLDPAIVELARSSKVILVPVDDGADDALGRARQAAIGLAGIGKARLVLLDRVDTTYADTPRVGDLDREAAQALERTYLVDGIDAAASVGVSATAFQHSLPGDEALSDAAEKVGADLLVVPEDLGAPGLLDRLKAGDAADRAQAAAPRGTTVIAVLADGTLERRSATNL